MANKPFWQALSDAYWWDQLRNFKPTDESTAKAEKFLDRAERGLTALAGANSILNTAQQAADIDFDYNMFNNSLSQARSIGTGNYNNFGEIAGEYNALNSLPATRSANQVRGMNDAQKVGSVGTGLLSGASAGAAFGPYGMAAGALFGGLGAAFGIVTGDNEANLAEEYQKNSVGIARTDGIDNLNAATENLQMKNFRGDVVNFAKRGGRISLREYAAKVTGNKDYAVRPVRRYCKGGIMVRIKK